MSVERLGGLDRPGEAWGAHRKGLPSPLQYGEQSYGAGRQAPRKRKEDKQAIVWKESYSKHKAGQWGIFFGVSGPSFYVYLQILTPCRGVLLLKSKSGSFARKQRAGEVAYSLKVTLQTYEAAITEWTLFGS